MQSTLPFTSSAGRVAATALVAVLVTTLTSCNWLQRVPGQAHVSALNASKLGIVFYLTNTPLRVIRDGDRHEDLTVPNRERVQVRWFAAVDDPVAYQQVLAGKPATPDPSVVFAGEFTPSVHESRFGSGQIESPQIIFERVPAALSASSTTGGPVGSTVRLVYRQ